MRFRRRRWVDCLDWAVGWPVLQSVKSRGAVAKVSLLIQRARPAPAGCRACHAGRRSARQAPATGAAIRRWLRRPGSLRAR
ncbi:hypothetical protein VARIO8X_120292 [Burkholderiales bacterium 8X]|nr:hypothetical protein VARIO8X_120292 [Burkholderiales bacterium 8X]